MRALVVGASGGLGSAFVAQLAADARYTQIIAWSRSAAVVTGEKILAKHIDLQDEATIAAAAQKSWRSRSRNCRDGAAPRWRFQTREILAFARAKRHDTRFRNQHYRSGLDRQTRSAPLATRPACRVRGIIGARRQHRRQPARRLAQLSRFESRAEPAYPVLQHRVVVHAAASYLRRPTPRHGGYRFVEALPSGRAQWPAVPTRGVRATSSKRARWLDVGSIRPRVRLGGRRNPGVKTPCILSKVHDA